MPCWVSLRARLSWCAVVVVPSGRFFRLGGLFLGGGVGFSLLLLLLLVVFCMDVLGAWCGGDCDPRWRFPLICIIVMGVFVVGCDALVVIGSVSSAAV